MNIADINILARLLTGTDTNSYTAANLLIAVNASYERITGRILEETSGGNWPYGDANYTAFPTYTLDLTNSTAEYQFDSLVTPIVIMGVEVLDNNSLWHVLSPITLEDIRRQGIAQVEYQKTDGRPIEYEKRENIIILYPAPDNGVSVTLTAGLKIFFLRTSDNYTSAQVTTGTKVPGFPSPYHDILAYEAAYTFAVAKGLSNINLLKAELDKRERGLLKLISKRNQDERPIMTMREINHI